MTASVEEAVYAKLSGNAAVNDAVAGRIVPQLGTQEPVFPLIVYQKTGGGGGTTLAGGSSSLKAYTLDILCYAHTEADAKALGKLVRDALTPNGSPWRDTAAGVLGCFHDDSAAETDPNWVRYHKETFTVWFRPTA